MTAKDYRELLRMANLPTCDRNVQTIESLIRLMLEQETDKDASTEAFHLVRRAGPAAFPALRNAWDREWKLGRNIKKLGRIHMCMTDIAGAAGNYPESRQQMRPIAQQEIPQWIECLQSDQSSLRLWAILILTCFVPYAPEQVEEVRSRISRLAVDADPQVRDRATAVLGILASPEKRQRLLGLA